MGSALSSSSSYLQYKNDFELVIRATKDLEYLLDTGFHTPCGKNIGLHDKITLAQQSHGLSLETVNRLRYLVTLRNKMVHDHEFNSLPDRTQFAMSYDSVEKELKEKLAACDSSSSSSCIIC